MKIRLIKAAAFVLAVLICATGCSREAQLSTGNADIHLPDPEERASQQIIGDVQAETSHDVTLHYASPDTLSLSSVTRSLQIKQNESLIERTLDALIEAASANGAVEAKIEHAETGCGIVSVDLSLEAGVNRSDQDYLLLCASIANTLLQFDDVEAVNILTGSRSDPVCSLPLGAFVNAQDNIAALYAQIQSESERFPSDGGGSLSRNVLLYFPSVDGRYMLPEMRELTFATDDYITEIIQALSDGPLVRSCSVSAIPASMDFLEKAPEIIVTDAGERAIELHFSGMLSDYLDFAAIEDWQLYASLALTLCSFVPEIDALRVYSGGNAVNGCSMNGVPFDFEDGLIRRSDFSSAIGGSAHLYLAGSDGKLVRREFPMAAFASVSPLNLLMELVSAAAYEDDGTASVFPEGVAPADILGVSMDGQTATINLSANFYVRCQSLNAMQERQLVYAMVNTLAELSPIDAVAFLVEGEALNSLAQDIYLGTRLLPDPGLIQASDETEQTE